MQQTGKRTRRRWLWLLLLLIPVLLAGGFFLRNAAGLGAAATQGQTATEKAVVGSIAVTVYGSGAIETGQSDLIYAPADARIDEVKVESGDQVKQGDVLAILSSDALDNEISQLEAQINGFDQQIMLTRQTGGSASITAPVSGRIMFIYGAAGDPVAAVMDQRDALCVLSADGKMKLELSGETGLKPGDEVQVQIGGDAADGVVMQQLNGLTIVELPDNVFVAGSSAAVINAKGRNCGSGTLQINKPVYVTGASGIIKSVRYEAGDKVSKGSRLFSLEEAGYAAAYLQLIDDRAQALLDLQEARTTQAGLILTAPAAGIVEKLNLTEKGLVQKNQLIGSIGETTSYKMQVMIDELDIVNVRLGQTADLKLAAFDYQTIPGIVERISAIGQTTGGVTTYPVTLRIEPVNGIMAGMSASADILVANKKDVLTIPLKALKIDGSRTYVTLVVKTETGTVSTRDQDVQVGLANGVLAEIVSGLAAGDTVQVVDSSADQNSGFFGMRGGQPPASDAASGG